jgi:hypothetical protein
MKIPVNQVKKYFNCISKQFICSNNSVKAIDSTFLKNQLSKFDKFNLIEINKNNFIVKTENINYNAQSNHQKNDEIIQNLQNFNIDISLMNNFFDKNIQIKHVKKFKIRKYKEKSQDKKENDHNHHQIDFSSDEDNDFPTLNEKTFVKKNTVPVHKIQNSNKNSNIFDQESSKFNKVQIFSMNKLNKQPNQSPKSPSIENSLKMSYKNTLASNITNKKKVSLISSKSNEILYSPRSKFLYSFRDDTTLGNKTNNEDYELVKINSKSGLDLSKMNWSLSNNTKHTSTHVSHFME